MTASKDISVAFLVMSFVLFFKLLFSPYALFCVKGAPVFGRDTH